MRTTYIIAVIIISVFSNLSKATADSDSTASSGQSAKTSQDKKWYENLSIRGYMQVRYNRLLETNEELGCDQCDKSWGNNGGFYMRRMRVILFGQISKQVYIYIQPDLASKLLVRFQKSVIAYLHVPPY
ncbi:MAG: hypothetical protein ACKOA1_08995 [Bacteroidota bacterium]